LYLSYNIFNFGDLAVDKSITLKFVSEKWYLKVVKSSKLDETVELLTHVWAVTHSNLGWDTGYPKKKIIGIHIPSMKITEILSYIRP
jgi:hypothetical protein